MPQIRSLELSDAVLKFPEPIPFNGQDNPAADVFFCAVGFEPRCLGVPSLLAKSDFKASRAVYFEPSTNRRDNKANLPRLKHYLSSYCKKVDSLQADEVDFVDRLERLLSVMGQKPDNSPPRVLMDISVFPNRILLKAMKAILAADINLTMLYSEAEIYHPTENEFRTNPKQWKDSKALGLERGVADVMPSRDYPGQHLDPLPDFLILFPSFRAERTRAVIARVDPSLLAVPSNKLFWILGKPHLPEDSWRADAMRELNDIPGSAPQLEISTFDYRETVTTLEKIYNDRSMEYNITISPLGSKLQALGTSLFCYMHPDVRIMFAIPKEYNAAHYSEGVKAMWQISFGKTSELRKQLDAVGTLLLQD